MKLRDKAIKYRKKHSKLFLENLITQIEGSAYFGKLHIDVKIPEIFLPYIKIKLASKNIKTQPLPSTQYYRLSW